MKRQYLLTKFCCSKCGSTLELTYDQHKNAGKYAEGEPTGAAKVEQLISIEPCSKCIEPIERMRSAIKTLVDI